MTVLSDLIDLLTTYRRVAIGVFVALFFAGISVGGYLLYAEQCHAQTQKNKESLDKLIVYQQREIERLKAQEELKRQLNHQIEVLCRSGELKDKKRCAEVGVTLE